MRRRIALVALLALPAIAAAQEPACPGAVAVTGAEIEAAGLVYLSDLLRLLPPLRRITLDAFSWRAADGTGIPSAEPSFLVLVDGVPADLDFFSEADLELLPVPLTEIGRVIYCPSPGPVAGVWAGRGTLRIETRPAEPGLTSLGAWQIGNETGDPGPFRYTDLATPNVDKSGPDVEGALRYEAAHFGGRAAVRVLRNYATDLALAPRTNTATRQVGSTNQRVVSAALHGVAGAATRHAFVLGGRYVSDLPFFEPAGRELPLRRLDAHADALGPLPAGLWYRLAAHLQQAEDEQSELADFDFRWRRRTLTAAVYDGGWPEQVGWHYGASLARTRVEGTEMANAGATLGTLYGAYACTGLAFSSRTALAFTAASGGGGDGRMGAKALQVLGVARTRHTLWLTLALDRRLPEEAPGYGYWRAHGFAGLERPAVAYVSHGPPLPHTEASVRLDGRYDGSAVRVAGGVAGWAARGLYVERAAFALAEDASTAVGTVTAEENAEGGSLAAWGQVTAEHGLWRGEASYSLLAPLGGSEAFRDAWSRVPRHRATAALTLRPDPGFSLRASFEAQSATRWAGYDAVAGAATRDGYVYTGGTPALALLDLAAEKGLWDRRAHVSLLFRNLLNTEERYHPLGAALDFRLYARLAVQLQGPLWIGPRSRNEG